MCAREARADGCKWHPAAEVLFFFLATSIPQLSSLTAHFSHQAFTHGRGLRYLSKNIPVGSASSRAFRAVPLWLILLPVSNRSSNAGSCQSEGMGPLKELLRTSICENEASDAVGMVPVSLQCICLPRLWSSDDDIGYCDDKEA